MALPLLFCLACGDAGNVGIGGPSSPSPSPGPLAPVTGADLAFCVDETNRYRLREGRPRLTRSTTIEAFAAEGAAEDGNGGPHQHFLRTNGGGVVTAENELHRVQASFFTSVQDAMTQAIAAFYAEGTNGSHFQNMMGSYTQVGCGVYVNDANNQITFVQGFR